MQSSIWSLVEGCLQCFVASTEREKPRKGIYPTSDIHLLAFLAGNSWLPESTEWSQVVFCSGTARFKQVCLFDAAIVQQYATSVTAVFMATTIRLSPPPWDIDRRWEFDTWTRFICLSFVVVNFACITIRTGNKDVVWWLWMSPTLLTHFDILQEVKMWDVWNHAWWYMHSVRGCY